MERIKEVIIRGKKFEVKTDLNDEDLENIVKIVNDALKESENMGFSFDFESMSIMALLSLAERVYFCEKKLDLVKNKVYSLIKKTDSI